MLLGRFIEQKDASQWTIGTVAWIDKALQRYVSLTNVLISWLSRVSICGLVASVKLAWRLLRH